MSYTFPKGPHSRLKVYKVAVSTPENKTLQNTSDFNYTVDLPYGIQNVVGMSLVEWSLPRDIIPTFYPTTTRLVGNNKLDFRLENTDISPLPADFTVTFPTKYFFYQDPTDPTLDYTVAVTTLMNQAIAANPTWAGKVSISCVAESYNQTLIAISTIDLGLPANSTTTLTLLFATGPNSDSAANLVMGFPTKTDVVSSATLFQLKSGTQVIESPTSVQLRSANYIDVYVEESNLQPLQRIFVRDPNYTTNIYASEGVSRLSVNIDNPPRKIDQLHIRLRYQDEGDPGDFLASPIIVPHAFTFHIISLVDEQESVPTYVQQNLTY